jgi:predicted ester cyclase
MSDVNKALVRTFFATADREERIPEPLCAPGFTARIAGYPPMNLEAFQQFVGLFYSAFSGFAHDIEDLLVEDDRVAFRAVARAMHTSPFMEIPASGKQISVPTIGMARIAEGKIVEWWNSPDQFGLMQQLGALPATSQEAG